ncbi:MAG: outer membrane lipoprotein-sorting protein [Rhodobacteraceae bacterium]|nr:outer membrane lipoprotein-sorting protein [Paracoccaceae bacterium]
MPALTRRHLIATSAAFLVVPRMALAQDPQAILRAAFNNWRAETSHAVMEMTIRGASGTRSLTMESWTKGRDTALVRFTAPARDAGNATLQAGRRTYVFNPRLNQVIQLPASAMQQSWMGSDFSYNDLTKTEALVNDYTHRLLETRRAGGRNIYVIEAIPKRGKPIVWGKQIVTVRDDYVLLGQQFYDQTGVLVREMVTGKVRNIGGRPYPAEITMSSVATPDQWTRVVTKSAEFDLALPGYLFTRSNLQNPR